MLYEIGYFKKGKEICGDDFNNRQEIEEINTLLISSLSALKTFSLPFTGKDIGKYAVITMNNNDKYYIDEEQYKNIKMDMRLGILNFQ